MNRDLVTIGNRSHIATTTPPSYNVAMALRDVGSNAADVTRDILDAAAAAAAPVTDNNGGTKNLQQQRPEIEHALLSVRFVAQHMENLDNFCEVATVLELYIYFPLPLHLTIYSSSYF